MSAPNNMAWIKCPVTCSDPSHTITIGIDSASQIRTIRTQCGPAEFELARALGSECCYSFVWSFREFMRETDYNKRYAFQAQFRNALACSPHLKSAVGSASEVTQRIKQERPAYRAAPEPESYVRRYARTGGTVDKIYAYSVRLPRVPGASQLDYVLERSYYSDGGIWANLAINGGRVATIARRAGSASTAAIIPIENCGIPANAVIRSGGQRKVMICPLCNKRANGKHNDKPEHKAAVHAHITRTITALRIAILPAGASW